MTFLLLIAAACDRAEPVRDPVRDAIDAIPLDLDDDGFDALDIGGDDCDDLDPAVHPDADDVPYDGIDQDCDHADLVDVDGDGAIGTPAGGDDCDDTDPNRFPGAADPVGDDLDRNCDGLDGVDADGDGFESHPSGGTDCRDDDPAIHPGAPDPWYDGVDSNCDRVCDYDADGDDAVLDAVDLATLAGTPCDHLVLDCDDTDPLADDNHVVDVSPADGETLEPGYAPSFSLWEPESGVSVVLTDDRGTVVATTYDSEFSTYTIRPVDPFPPRTTITLEVTYSCGVFSSRFTTP